MLYSRSLHTLSFVISCFAKATVIVYTLSAGDYDFASLTNIQEYIRTQRNCVFRKLMFAFITFRISKRMIKRSVVAFIIFTIVIIKLLSVQVKLVKLARFRNPLHGPVRLTVYFILLAVLLYVKLVVEISWAVYYLIELCRNPSWKDTCLLLFGLLRFVDWSY